MTQENKELLLKDLCARLPYGVIVSPIDCSNAKLIGFKDDYPILFDLVSQKEYDKPWEIEYVKPYLRPMSSMTEEERKELATIECGDFSLDEEMTLRIDFYNKHHFDYRGLIEKGLALEALEGMYD